MRSQLLKIYYISLLFLLVPDKMSAFQMNDTLYIKYDDKMIVNEIKDPLGDYQVRLNMALINKGDDRVTTYEFNVNNINKDFKYLQFNKIGDTISGV